MGQKIEHVLSDAFGPEAALDLLPDRLYQHLYEHQLAYRRRRYFYCWHSARIYNQYQNLGMVEEYYRTLAQVRADLSRNHKDGRGLVRRAVG